MKLSPGCPCSNCGHAVSGCPCASLPDAIAFTSDDTSGFFPAADSFAYQPTPSWAVGLAFTDVDGTGHCYLAGPYTDSSTGDDFYWLLHCNSARYALTRIFEFSIFGDPFEDSERFVWQVAGLAGNTCTPFHFSNGLTQNLDGLVVHATIEG